MNPLIYLPLILAGLVITIAIIVGILKLGVQGNVGPTGPTGPTGSAYPAQYQELIVEGSTWLGSNYNGKMYIVYHNRMDITARNTVAGDNFVVVNPTANDLTVYHQRFVSPIGPVTIAPLTQTQFFVTADANNDLSFFTVTQPLSQKITPSSGPPSANNEEMFLTSPPQNPISTLPVPTQQISCASKGRQRPTRSLR